MAKTRLYITVDCIPAELIISRTTPTGRLAPVTSLTKMEAIGFATDLLTKALQIQDD